MSTKSSTQKLNIRWQDRSWQPEIRQTPAGQGSEAAEDRPRGGTLKNRKGRPAQAPPGGRPSCSKIRSGPLRLFRNVCLKITSRRKIRVSNPRKDL